MSFSNRIFVRGVFPMAIALHFGLTALSHYSTGQLRRSGPKPCPLMISCFLLVIGLLTGIRSRFVDPVPLNYNVRKAAADEPAARTRFIPLTAIGIPKNAVMALMMVALIVKGISPGPHMIASHPDLFWGSVESLWLATVSW